MGWIRRPRRAGPIVANNPTIVMTTAVTGTSARPNKPSSSPSLCDGHRPLYDRSVAEEITCLIVDDHDLPDSGDIVFIEVTIGDYSDFESRIEVHGKVRHFFTE